MARRMTKAQREWRPGMPKKRRSTKVLFASTVLSLEAFVVFFATLAVFGLRRDEDLPGPHPDVRAPPQCLLLVLTCAVLTKKWGIALGWILQLVLIAGGFLERAGRRRARGFALTWLYGIRQGVHVTGKASPAGARTGGVGGGAPWGPGTSA